LNTKLLQSKLFSWSLFGFASLILTSCELRQAMYDQEKYEPLEKSTFFADGQSWRPQVEGTVARGELREDTHFYEGTVNGELSNVLPIELNKELLERGQQRYNIYCSPCHDRTGQGNGIIVKRGLKQPTSFHDDRLKNMPVGYFFDVITNGYGVMYSYASRVPIKDRWAIAAYIRTLQLSQNVDLEKLPVEDQKQFQ